jgi:hypothetical protein
LSSITEAGAAHVDGEAPPVTVHRGAVDRAAEVVQQDRGVLGGGHLLVKRVGLDLVGGEVAEVLVDPVGGEAAGDPLEPPRLGGHVRAPRGRGVPVVDQLVVVEDHHARDGGEQPADLGVAPRLEVQLRVLVEGHRPGRPGPGWPAGAAAAQEVLDLGEVLSGVHLVAEQDDQVGGAVDGSVISRRA